MAKNRIDCNLSPKVWPTELRLQAEELDRTTWHASASKNVRSRGAIISTTGSPISLCAGLQALKCGGTACDAAAVMALTQVCTTLGSVVSYAGILSLLYYDAAEKKTFAMDAGFNSYLEESAPLTIPALKELTWSQTPTTEAATDSLESGRQTLVPGFMAGIESMHQRFGKLEFHNLFDPAIWYAEKGIQINPAMQYYFATRQEQLSRTPEGRLFLAQGGTSKLWAGEVFYQKQLAQTLRNTAEQGAKYFYSGEWAETFVNIVRREGGKATLKDLTQYAVLWSEPIVTEFFNHKIYCPPKPSRIAYIIFPALHLAEELSLLERPPYWEDPLVMRDLQRIFDLTDLCPSISPEIQQLFEREKIDHSSEALLSRNFARAVVPILDKINCARLSQSSDRHSHAIVVIDNQGNIAALTHSINTVVWGGTGIVVGGVPISDAAGFQQEKLAPGERVGHELPPTIVFAGDQPVLATAAIGASLAPETLRTVLYSVGKRMTLAEVQSAPPLFYNYVHMEPNKPISTRGVILQQNCYSMEFIETLKAYAPVHLIEEVQNGALRGTVAAVAVNPSSNIRTTAQTKGLLSFVAETGISPPPRSQ